MNNDEVSPDDQLFERVIAHLRTESVPEMPQVHVSSQTVRPPAGSLGWVWSIVAISALAASIVGIVMWRTGARQLPGPGPNLPGPNLAGPNLPGPNLPGPDLPGSNSRERELADIVQPPDVGVQESKVVRLEVKLTDSLVQLERNLDSIDEQIVELRSKAGMLDARRRAAELLVQF